MPDKDPLIAVPMVLPMGWTKSPPTFCTVGETISVLTNAVLSQRWTVAGVKGWEKKVERQEGMRVRERGGREEGIGGRGGRGEGRG